MNCDLDLNSDLVGFYMFLTVYYLFQKNFTENFPWLSRAVTNWGVHKICVF